MRSIPPLPRRWGRVLSAFGLLAWIVQMGVLVRHNYLEASSLNLASDLSQYGSSASWKGIYSRGSKIGFSVGQTKPTSEGYEISEDGRLQMSMLGAITAARVHTEAHVDRQFNLRRFLFSLDPGTGPLQISGTLDGKRLALTIKTPSGERSETRELAEPPALALNLPRQLAAAGLSAGMKLTLPVFDPTTLRNMPMTVEVKDREVVRGAGRPVPAFRVETSFSGLQSTSWVTDTGEVVREESPTGLIVVKETRDRATALAVPGEIQQDMLETAAVVPRPQRRIDDPRAVERLSLTLTGIDSLLVEDLQGAGQTARDGTFEIRDARKLAPGPRERDLDRYLRAEPLLEADAPEIVAEAQKAVAGADTPKLRAERLVRYVNALLEKRPTVSFPSALEVLRTRTGDCNEHTALYVAMARALGLPARIAVGLVYLHGAFYYHAWPEVWVAEADSRGAWLPVDPTLNEFPADATHVRLARGGLERQAAILPLLGRVEMRIHDVDLRPGANPILVGQAPTDSRPLDIPLPRRDGSGSFCWSRPR